MATYPTGTYAPASKANGQVIQASMFNDPDAEIIAVEDALRNGLAHGLTISTGGLTVSTGSVNIGGPSSLATLQVNGASTFAGAVTFSSGVTFNGPVTFSTGFATRPQMPAPDLVILTGSTSPFADATSGGIAWPTQTTALNSSIHSTATNPDRVRPQSTGVWVFDVTVTLSTGFGDPSTGSLDLIIKDSSGGTVDFRRVGGTMGGRAPSAHGLGMKRFDSIAATPYLRAVLTQRGGSSHSLNGALSFARFYQL